MSGSASYQSAATWDVCPKGTKMFFLDLGTLTADEGWLMRGGNTASFKPNDPNQPFDAEGGEMRGKIPTDPAPRKVRELPVYAILIDHPEDGLILWETGCAENMQGNWPKAAADVFPRTRFTKENRLPEAIKAAGYNIKDVKHVVIGHLHLDHAGGLDYFSDPKEREKYGIGNDTKIWAHEEELKHAWWAVTTKMDSGVYLEHYLKPSLNWHTFNEREHPTELFRGISFHFCPGHTPGLVCAQINLPDSGTWFATSDQYHIKEHYEIPWPHGWLARNHEDWFRSHQKLQRLHKKFKGKMVYGHDIDVWNEIKHSPQHYT